MNRFLIFFSIISFFSVSHPNDVCARSTKKYQLSICAIFRDEAPYLKEWIEYHRLVGVEHFYLVNHLSKDHYLQVLDPYIKQGIVEIYNAKKEIHDGNWHDIQIGSYKRMIKISSKNTKWLAIIDTDEFLVPVEKDNLQDFLKDYDQFGGVALNWQMYGTSGVEKIEDHELMIEQLLWKAKPDHSENTHIKTIVKPELVENCTAHVCFCKREKYIVNENKERMKNSAKTPYVSINKARINHYWTRDEHYFLNKKIPSRVQRWGEQEHENALRRNERYTKVYDDIMLRFVLRLKERMLASP